MYCVFHFLEIDEVEGIDNVFDIDRINEFIKEMVSVVPTIQRNVLAVDVAQLMESEGNQME